MSRITMSTRQYESSTIRLLAVIPRLTWYSSIAAKSLRLHHSPSSVRERLRQRWWWDNWRRRHLRSSIDRKDHQQPQRPWPRTQRVKKFQSRVLCRINSFLRQPSLFWQKDVQDSIKSTQASTLWFRTLLVCHSNLNHLTRQNRKIRSWIMPSQPPRSVFTASTHSPN